MPTRKPQLKSGSPESHGPRGPEGAVSAGTDTHCKGSPESRGRWDPEGAASAQTDTHIKGSSESHGPRDPEGAASAGTVHIYTHSQTTQAGTKVEHRCCVTDLRGSPQARIIGRSHCGLHPVIRFDLRNHHLFSKHMEEALAAVSAGARSIGVYCNHGIHRSVGFAAELQDILTSRSYQVEVHHVNWSRWPCSGRLCNTCSPV
jgi:hypothetical protein